MLWSHCNDICAFVIYETDVILMQLLLLFIRNKLLAAKHSCYCERVEAKQSILFLKGGLLTSAGLVVEKQFRVSFLACVSVVI